MFLCVALAASARAGLPPVGSSGDRPEDADPFSRYRELIQRYRAGEREPALAGLRSLGTDVIETAAARVTAGCTRQCPDSLGLSAEDLEAAGLMHTDLAFRESGAARQRQLKTAEQWIAAGSRSRGPRTHCRWLLARALDHHARFEFDSALGLYHHALRLCPNDPDALASLGLLYETFATSKLAGSAWTTEAPGNVLASEARRERALAFSDAQEAESCFKRALALSPDRPEIRLHLARVWQALGKVAEARAALGSLLATADDRPLVYAANLLLGGLHEAQGAADDAIRCYRAAQDADPEAQTAALALSHALHRKGQRRESVEVIERLLAEGREPKQADGWWPLKLGPLAAAEPQEWVLAPLRRELAR